MFFDLQHKRNQIYWFCQITGWSLYVIINMLLIYSYEGITWSRVLLLVYYGILGISFTHILRAIIKKRHWLKFPPRKMIPAFLLASLLMAIIIFGILYFIVHITNLIPRENINIGVAFGNIFNISVVLIVWSLIYIAFHLLENFKAAEIEKLIWEAAVKDFELKTLKSQLNPHFMFNALNSIRSLIEENPDRAKSAITQLSNIFRYSLKIERTETVPLEEEIKTVQDYLALEQVRFEERLKYDISVEPSAKNIEIPPMMVQTLVENGIKHGISKIPEGGTITVKAEVKDYLLCISIKNTGSLKPETHGSASGFGIANTKQRLHLLYGEKASFQLYNSNGTVNAEVTLPIGGKTQ